MKLPQEKLQKQNNMIVLIKAVEIYSLNLLRFQLILSSIKER